MAKTKIDWCDYTINPVKGLCPMECSYCYARRMYKRFKLEEKIIWSPSSYDLVDTIKKPSRIFVGSTFELFHDSLPYNWMEYNLLTTKKYPQHTFIFLTKQPQNLVKWSPFPDNCWVGVSTTGFDCRSCLEDIFKNIKAKVKFVSIEPLLDYTPMDFRWVNWIIIGQQTPISNKTQPKIRWISEMVKSADKENVPVFLKDNLNPLFVQNCCEGFNQNKQLFKVIDNFPTRYHLRQEFPRVK